MQQEPDASQVLGFSQSFIERVIAEFPDPHQYERLHRHLRTSRQRDVLTVLQQEQARTIDPFEVCTRINQGDLGVKELKEQAERLCRIKELYREMLRNAYP